MSETSQPFLGIISGERRRDHAAVAERVEDFIKPGGMRMPIFNIEASREVIRLSDSGIEYSGTDGQKYLDEIYAGDIGKSVGEVKTANEIANDGATQAQDVIL